MTRSESRELITASCDGALIFWDTATCKQIEQIPAHRGPVRCIAMAPDGRTLASGGEDGAVILWNIETRQEVAIFAGAHKGNVHAVAFSPDGKWLASGGTDKVRFWRAASMDEIRSKQRAEQLADLRTLDSRANPR